MIPDERGKNEVGQPQITKDVTTMRPHEEVAWPGCGGKDEIPNEGLGYRPE